MKTYQLLEYLLAETFHSDALRGKQVLIQTPNETFKIGGIEIENNQVIISVLECDDGKDVE